MEEKCKHPNFGWMPFFQCWSACLNCGELAWDHKQSDPKKDIENCMYATFNARDHADYPPVMKELV